MKSLFPLIILAILTPVSAAENAPHDWFENEYAPLWADAPGDNIEKLLSYYEEEMISFESDGSISRDNLDDWLVTPMREWLADGWLAAELTAFKMEQVNATTVALTARWLDHYESGEQETSCEWYIAHWTDGQWRFAASADADCEQLESE